jgi:hypothetical protein
MRKFLAILTAALGGAAIVAGAAGAASAETGAASSFGVINRATSSYTSPSTDSTAVHNFNQGDGVETLCYTEGEHINNIPHWIRVRSDGHMGFVHRAAINTSPELPRC